MSTQSREERVIEAVRNLHSIIKDRLEEDNQHLLDEDYVADATMSEEQAEVLYQNHTHVVHEDNPEEVAYGILELYYNYRSSTEAEDDTLLAAATYAVMHRLIRHHNLTREDVAKQFGVSKSVISDHNLDMLDHRFARDTVEEAAELVNDILRHERGDDTEPSSLADFKSD